MRDERSLSVSIISLYDSGRDATDLMNSSADSATLIFAAGAVSAAVVSVVSEGSVSSEDSAVSEDSEGSLSEGCVSSEVSAGSDDSEVRSGSEDLVSSEVSEGTVSLGSAEVSFTCSVSVAAVSAGASFSLSLTLAALVSSALASVSFPSVSLAFASSGSASVSLTCFVSLTVFFSLSVFGALAFSASVSSVSEVSTAMFASPSCAEALTLYTKLGDNIVTTSKEAINAVNRFKTALFMSSSRVNVNKQLININSLPHFFNIFLYFSKVYKVFITKMSYFEPKCNRGFHSPGMKAPIFLNVL